MPILKKLVSNNFAKHADPSPTSDLIPPVEQSVTAVQTSITNMLEFPYLRTRTAYTNKLTQIPTSSDVKKIKKRRSSDTSSDEERWLHAIETGKLEDVDNELKKIKNPKLMTARQRAMYERTQDQNNGFTVELIALPNGYKEKEKPQTAEEINKAVLKSQKRKQQADERREKDKLKTMERLLKKQESHKQRVRSKQSLKPSYPKITYINSIERSIILVPQGFEFPLKAQLPRTTPSAELCCISGCGNRKAYNCSITKNPLCSLACYKKNRQY
ncbi:INO80 complex subunit B [Drosophila kikkawai]|uniref:INO80 complex subunit B n=1 Tax=Drosophila kikkawai TaxID=30033 RepID=A0A6P4HSP2_DROKI|nr:INO80 complex subunit B [Drosophila kikkawai]KAH8318594.1 hypothetical protein KR059_003712 [Drosophila kikkawai]